MLEVCKLSWHIVRRNWWIYRKDLLSNISPTLSDPAFFILSLGVGLGAYVSHLNGRSYLEFLAPGLAVSTAVWTAFFETSYGFYIRMTFENIFKAMLTTPIGVREIVIGEFLWVALKGALMVFGVSVVLFAFGLVKNPVLLLLTPFVGILVSLPLGALGLIASCYVRNINQFQIFYSFVISPLYFFSGVFFPVEQMPGTLKLIASSLPLYQGVRMSQALFWDESVMDVWIVHAPILIAYSAVLLAWAFVKVKSKLEN